MTPTWSIASAATSVAVAGLLVYRANTQSLTHDEALTWRLVLDSSFSRLFNFYDSNHHVLSSVLSWLSIHALGTSELTLRLPCLLGAFIWLGATRKLLIRLTGSTPWLLLGTILLGVNPYLLDLLCVARGYGLGLGFLALGSLPLLACHDDGPNRGRTAIFAGALLGLAIAANLTFFFGAVGLGLASVALKIRREGLAAGACHGCLLALTGAIVGGAIVAMPLRHADFGTFFVGRDNLAETGREFALISLQHHSYLLAGAERVHMDRIFVLANWVGGVLVLTSFVAGARALFRRTARPEVALFSLALASCLLVHFIAWHLGGVRYPRARTGLYLLVFFVLAIVGSLAQLERRGPRLAAWVLALPLLAASLAFALQLQVSHYREWIYDADSREIIEAIEDLSKDRASRPVRVGVDWEMEPALTMYRSIQGSTWLAPLSRLPTPGSKEPIGLYDFYVLGPMRRFDPNYPQVEVLREFETSGAFIARLKPR